jgi:predicted 3-demethylubiquinone-9 3-methyltransferase (glyoxalase superfamily)
MQSVTPFLWFNAGMREAVNFYVSLVPNSRVTDPSPVETSPTMRFELDGVEYMALEGGPEFKLTEAFSLFVRCKDQAEVDRYWSALTADDGEESMCGWLKDRWGLSWQIVPDALVDGLSDPDPETSQRVLQAMFQMRKLVVADLEKARAG